MPRFFSAPPKPSHTKVFERAAETGFFVPFEMAQRDHDIGIHNRLADLCFPDQRQIDGDMCLIRSFESIGNNHMTARLQRGETVEISRVHVVERVFTAADVERVAVGQKNAAAQRAHVVRHDPGVLRAQIGEVAQLAEVDLDGGVAVGKIDGLEARLLEQPVQLLGQRLMRDAEIGKIDFRGLHLMLLLAIVSI